LAGYEFWKNQLAAAGVRVVAASVDPIDKAREVAGVVSFPVGFGATREIGERLGAWWEAKRGYIQPAEFIVSPEGKVLASSYSAGPLGRMDAAEVVRMANFLDAQKK
jgi:peroxiredoxin